VKISAVHPEHTKDSVGYVFDFDGIKVYVSGDTKNHQKLKKVASFHPDVAWMNAMNEISP
jgi:L-ascorbate metabolism protein UlaG (beta-lactamase superfamily)